MQKKKIPTPTLQKKVSLSSMSTNDRNYPVIIYNLYEVGVTWPQREHLSPQKLREEDDKFEATLSSRVRPWVGIGVSLTLQLAGRPFGYLNSTKTAIDYFKQSKLQL